MNLLVSDYDFTINLGKLAIMYNMNAINKFVKNGNKFCIATANSYQIMKREYKKNKIHSDYLSVSNGLALFDENKNVINAKYISEKEKTEILYFLKNYLNYNITLLNEYGNKSNNNVIEIIVDTKSISKALQIKNVIETYFSDFVVFSWAGLFVTIRHISDKIDSVKILEDKLKLPKENIYTVGDDINDKSMIEEYNGYHMLLSNPKMYKSGNGHVSSVKSLIKKIER